MPILSNQFFWFFINKNNTFTFYFTWLKQWCIGGDKILFYNL
ncbi:hypothetical protein DDB_G0288171 [Dictyostelium discoideum AX4]|uniref:Uncharacterized protein n=1 Tax=Dictyostelium discoideum TaxID=44689 RepID=Q54JB5_DICDI|nr:hypothetical protein DDB_G0288171 [Dictyostelium discoideum AX4]EAL63373.1 hypothetical protein DDB_G0288171 [Dictyostelium discoideum AX4]|eukprot:XP_636878.1 hypothetical protein DDB_G0288171 [Dictyostelium discoideum AX4]